MQNNVYKDLYKTGIKNKNDPNVWYSYLELFLTIKKQVQRKHHFILL